MLKVKTTEAVGLILCHDVTKIVPGEFKGAAFKKGHVIKPEDIDELLKLGKEHLFVWECDEGNIHEDEAALRIVHAATGPHLVWNDPKEGKVTITAERRGLLFINVAALNQINDIEEIALATRHTYTVMEEGDIAAGCRVIPLVIAKEKIEQIEMLCHENGPVLQVKPFFPFTVGVITTGNEVFSGRIQDRFGPIVKEKLEQYSCPITQHILLPDDPEQIAAKIKELVALGSEMIIVTGGMSVDPDDATPGGIKRTGAQIVTYGTPIFPGAMFLLAYLGDVPILGLPGCVMYCKTTVFDLILPRLFAKVKVTRPDITRLGHGGLCLECKECHYPSCSFGKG